MNRNAVAQKDPVLDLLAFRLGMLRQIWEAAFAPDGIRWSTLAAARRHGAQPNG